MSDYNYKDLDRTISNLVGRGLANEIDDILKTMSENDSAPEFLKGMNATIILSNSPERFRRHLMLLYIEEKTGMYDDPELVRNKILNLLIGMNEFGAKLNDYTKVAGVTNKQLKKEVSPSISHAQVKEMKRLKEKEIKKREEKMRNDPSETNV